MMLRPILLIAALSMFTAACAGTSADRAGTHFGDAHPLGEGTVQSFVTIEPDGTPSAIGLRFATGALDGLPATPTTTGRCFDLNGNGKIDAKTECEGDHETRLILPAAVADRSDLLIKWVMLNWNVHGHVPQEVYGAPHFDMHFYIADQEAVDGIRLGSCGLFINCEDFDRATIDVAAKYLHPGRVSVNAAVAMMGNHLIDVAAPEFATPPQPFTHAYIIGVYGGEITYYEPMITLDYLMSQPAECFPIKQPEAWQKTGFHPTAYCIRHDADTGELSVSLEAFVHRMAS